MSVQSLLETFLIHVVANESDAAAQHEQRINGTDVDVLLGFFAVIVKGKRFFLNSFAGINNG